MVSKDENATKNLYKLPFKNEVKISAKIQDWIFLSHFWALVAANCCQIYRRRNGKFVRDNSIVILKTKFVITKIVEIFIRNRFPRMKMQLKIFINYPLKTRSRLAQKYKIENSQKFQKSCTELVALLVDKAYIVDCIWLTLYHDFEAQRWLLKSFLSQ